MNQTDGSGECLPSSLSWLDGASSSLPTRRGSLRLANSEAMLRCDRLREIGGAMEYGLDRCVSIKAKISDSYDRYRVDFLAAKKK